MNAKIEKDLLRLRNRTKAAFLAKYFKTGIGEYGAGDVFLGISVPTQRALAKKYRSLPLADVRRLLTSTTHEFRYTALLILVEQYSQADLKQREAIVQFYLKNIRYINNWDLVDTSAPYILGDFLFAKDKAVLYKMSHSKNLWERRIAIISTHGFIKKNHFDDTLKIAAVLLHDGHDLIHKAVGWMLREVGNRDRRTEMQFLDTHHAEMPRTMLRYAIEKFDEPSRLKYLRLRPKKAM